MPILHFEDFKNIFNEIIFEKSKADLLEKISSSPSRYVGLFRPTKPKAKILQNLLQSHEIRFGDAFEKIIEEYLKLKGCNLLPKKLKNQDGDALNLDQSFQIEDITYFIEQKVRDDHDSTKKRGQISNFEKKLNVLISEKDEDKLVGIFYFVDPEHQKNKKYYTRELEKIKSDYNVETYIFYGKSLFEYFNMPEVWDEIIEYLKLWKCEIPDFPEINFDLDSENTFEEIKDLKPIVFRRLSENDKVFDEIILTLFPEKKTIKMLIDYFKKLDKTIYKTIASNLERRIK